MDIRIFALGACLTLAACASPQQRCIEAAMTDLRTTRAEIAEIETALERGYRVTGTRVDVGLKICAEPGDGITFCTAGRKPVYEPRRPIDRAAERARLARLRDLEERQAAEAARAVRACGG